MISLLYHCVALSRLFDYFKNSSIRKKNKNLFNNKKSNKVCILGLGPSLKDFDRTRTDCDTIAVNRYIFYNEQNQIKLSPNYYCFADDAFYKHEISVLENAINLFPDSYFLLNGKYIKNIKPIVNMDNVFFGFFQKGFCNPRKSINFCRRIPMNVNVVGLAIELALYLGYEEIELYGLDFTNAFTKKLEHAYAEESTIVDTPYRISYYYNSIAFEQFHLYNEYAKLHNIKIVNKSKISLVDCFSFEVN